MIGVRVKLTFPEELVREPIIARMVKELDIVPNIRRADVGEHDGWIICELDGDAGTVDRAVDVAARTRASRWTCSATSSRAEPVDSHGTGTGRRLPGPRPEGPADEPPTGTLTLAANRRNWDERVSDPHGLPLLRRRSAGWPHGPVPGTVRSRPWATSPGSTWSTSSATSGWTPWPGPMPGPGSRASTSRPRPSGPPEDLAVRAGPGGPGRRSCAPMCSRRPTCSAPGTLRRRLCEPRRPALAAERRPVGRPGGGLPAVRAAGSTSTRSTRSAWSLADDSPTVRLHLLRRGGAVRRRLRARPTPMPSGRWPTSAPTSGTTASGRW